MDNRPPVPVSDDEAVAAVVDGLRKKNDLSVNALSLRTKMARPTLTRRLAGSSFTLDEIREVARVLGTTVGDIEAEAQALLNGATR
jgi:transcriptional regulator with XRE-family HTH domain